MKLGQAITAFTSCAQTRLTTAQIISHISSLDGRIHDGVIALYPGAEVFSGYPADEDLSTDLLVPYPYEDVYLAYLLSVNALYDGESDSYANYSALFNTLLSEFSKSYHRAAARRNTKISIGGAKCCRS